jgi:hypothetical protein
LYCASGNFLAHHERPEPFAYPVGALLEELIDKLRVEDNDYEYSGTDEQHMPTWSDTGQM